MDRTRREKKICTNELETAGPSATIEEVRKNINKSIPDISRTARPLVNHTVHNAIILIIIQCANTEETFAKETAKEEVVTECETREGVQPRLDDEKYSIRKWKEV